MSPAFGLGIDFGTSNTVALMRWPDGRVRPLLFDANPLLPSAVFAPTKPGPAGSPTPATPTAPAAPGGVGGAGETGPGAAGVGGTGVSAGGAGATGADVGGAGAGAVVGVGLGELVVGGDALHHARFDPAGLEPNPKQHIDEQGILLGAREVAVVDLIAAVLRFVFAEARRVAGSDDFAVAIAHPAGWGTARRGVLAEAARRAGLGAAQLVPEPVAAAHAFTAVLGQQVAEGKALVVYDLGAGTFDASVVVRRAVGFEPMAVDGLTDVGGLDIDATIVGWLGDRYSAGDPELWARLADAQDPESLRHRRMLWHDARVAKEMLSRAPAVVLQMPAPLNVDAQLTREEFEAAAKPLLERTVFTTAALIRAAGVAPQDVAGVLLVGGGSRIPLVATMLHRALGIAPTITEQPEIVVAEGCLLSLSQGAGGGAAGEGGPLWPSAAAVAAPYASMAGPVASPNSPVGQPSGVPSVGQPSGVPSVGQPSGAAPVGQPSGAPLGGQSVPVGSSPVGEPSPVGFSAPPVVPVVEQPVTPFSTPVAPVSGGAGWGAAPVSAQPAGGGVGWNNPAPASGPGWGASAAPVSAQPAGGAPTSGPAWGASGAPVSAQPAGGAPTSGPAWGAASVPAGGQSGGTVYQTGQFPVVAPRPQGGPRFVPPPLSPVAPVSPGAGSRVIPVYEERGPAVRPHSPVPAPAPPEPGRGNVLNALLVVVALIALAAAGTTIYLVQRGTVAPSSSGQSPAAERSSGGDSVAGGDTGQVVGADNATSAAGQAQPSGAPRTEYVTMPDLSGLYVDYAKEKLRDTGFAGKVVTQQRPTDDPDQVGHVLSQDPKAQKQVAKNGTVTLWIGATPKASASASATCRPGACPTPSGH